MACGSAGDSGFHATTWLRALLIVLVTFAAPHPTSNASTGPEVVVSIKPVHALVAGVMGETGSPRLLVDGAASPHTYQMRPSEAAALRAADLIVWVGETLETFLARPIASLGTDAEVLTLQRSGGIRLLRNRESGIWSTGSGPYLDAADSHADADDGAHGHDYGHGELDAHIWLDPDNAQRIVETVAAVLARIHPEAAAAYRRNAAAMRARIAALETSLRDQLAPVRSHAFVVFHDGYQYFERAFELNGIGAVILGPARLPGAKRLTSLRRALIERDARCVFIEPQFEPRLAQTVIEHTPVRVAVLDLLGADVGAGADAWFTILRRMGDSVAECLGGA